MQGQLVPLCRSQYMQRPPRLVMQVFNAVPLSDRLPGLQAVYTPVLWRYDNTFERCEH